MKRQDIDKRIEKQSLVHAERKHVKYICKISDPILQRKNKTELI